MGKIQAIVAALRDGTMSDGQVARRHGVSRGGVWQIRRRACIPSWTPPLKPPAVPSPVFWTDRDVAT